MKKALLFFVLVFASPFVRAEPAPDWQLPWLGADGQLALAELQGSVVLIDFWASWCVPCRLSVPSLQALRDEFVDLPVAFVPISVDESAAEAYQFLQRYAPGLHSLHDRQGAVAQAYGLVGMPTSFIIDQQGIVRQRHEGFRAGDEHVWRQEIQTLLLARP